MASAYFFFFPFFFIGIDLFSSLCKILRRAPSLEMLWPTAFSNLYVVVSRGTCQAKYRGAVTFPSFPIALSTALSFVLFASFPILHLP